MLKDLIRKLTVLIYDLIISRFLTITSHVLMMNHLTFKPTDRLMLDVGVGTGKPLKAIAQTFPQDLKVVGVDINANYVEKCKENFADNHNVEIYERSFYDVNALGKGLYDIVFFSFSFMLMPDKEKALKLANKILRDDGRLVFMLTLNSRKNALFERLKPLIKRVTSVDFGEVVYENKFLEMVTDAGFEIVRKQRLRKFFNPLFWIFPIHYIEAYKIKTLREESDAR